MTLLGRQINKSKFIKITILCILLILVLFLCLYGLNFKTELSFYLLFNRLAYAGEGSEFLQHGPYMYLEPGNYKAIFRLKVSDNKLNAPVATIDVVANGARDQLACVVLKGTNFTSPYTYQDFELLFHSSGEEDFEFRVYHHGNSKLWIDRVKLMKLEGNREKFLNILETESPMICHGIGQLVSDLDASGYQAWVTIEVTGAKPLSDQIVQAETKVYDEGVFWSEAKVWLFPLALFALGSLLILACILVYRRINLKKLKQLPILFTSGLLKLAEGIRFFGLHISKFMKERVLRKYTLVSVLVGWIVFSIFIGNVVIFHFVIRAEYLFLLYLLAVLILKVDSRFSVAVALLLLACCPFCLIGGQEEIASRLANYAYGFLVIGIILGIIFELIGLTLHGEISRDQTKVEG